MSNTKKCTSEPAEGDVVELSEVTPAASDEDASVEIRRSEESISQSSTLPLTCNEICCYSPHEKPFQPSTEDFNAKKQGPYILRNVV